MRSVIGLLLVITLLAGAPVLAQGDDVTCTDDQIQDAIAGVIEDLQAARSLSGADALQTLLQAQASIAMTDRECRTIATASGSHVDPIPMGEYYELLDYGRIRIAEVVDPYLGDVAGLDEGYRVFGVAMEYECTQPDPTLSCEGKDLLLSTVVTDGGVIIDPPIVIATSSDPKMLSQEAFGGNVLSGYYFVAVPSDAIITQAKFVTLLDWSIGDLYFSLE